MVAFFSDRARWIADCSRKVVGRTRPLNLRLRQRLRTVRIALKMALARRKVGEIIARMSGRRYSKWGFHDSGIRTTSASAWERRAVGVEQLASNRQDMIRTVAKNGDGDGAITLICVVLLRVALFASEELLATWHGPNPLARHEAVRVSGRTRLVRLSARSARWRCDLAPAWMNQTK